MTAHITHQTCSIDGLIPIQVFQVLPKAKNTCWKAAFHMKKKGAIPLLVFILIRKLSDVGKKLCLSAILM